MDLGRIRARREHIVLDSPCDGCGSTLAACLASRGKDPTAPSWFGCCARGLEMHPCHHSTDAYALIRLIKEIETGEVTSPEDELLNSITEHPLFEAGRRGRSLRARILAMAADQDESDARGGVMKVEHKGFKVIKMIGDMSAEVSDDGEYVSVVLVDGGHKRSYDLNGLQTFIEELEQIRTLASHVDHQNNTDRYPGGS